MEKIYRKDIEAKIREKAKKKMVSRTLKKSKNGETFWSGLESGVRPLGFASLDSMFRNCTYKESLIKLKEAFDDAAEHYGVPMEELRFEKGWRAGTNIKGERIETDEEFEDRIQYETDDQVNNLRQLKACKAQAKRDKRAKIEKLQKELENLQK